MPTVNDPNGTPANVTDGRVQTYSVSVSPLHAASMNGNAFAWNAVSADIDAGDTALLVRNDADDRLLVIEKLYVYCDVATSIDVHVITSSTATLAGTAVTGVCLNRSLNAVADATAKADETGETQGSIILTLATAELTTHQEGIDYDFQGAVILGKNDCIGVDLVAEPGAFECTIIGYFL